MQSTQLLASFGMLAALAALAAGPALGGEREHDDRGERHRAAQTQPAPGADQGMREVPNSAAQGDASYGWRYFSDPAALRAVVISPQGDYYLSRGKGLRWVAAAPKGV